MGVFLVIKVCGLLVHGDRPRLTKGYRNRIRAFKHLIEANKIAEDDLERIKGHLAYAQTVPNGGGQTTPTM